MRRDEVLRILREHKEELEAQGVMTLSIFGSVARDAATPESDVDLLVEFSMPVGLIQFERTRLYLEKLLGIHVDMVTPNGLKKVMREEVLREAVRAT